jgi:hypothetical protein
MEVCVSGDLKLYSNYSNLNIALIYLSLTCSKKNLFSYPEFRFLVIALEQVRIVFELFLQDSDN